MGALTLLVSSLITGTMGPWLPYQMFTAGWVGLSAPLCRPTVWLFNGQGTWLEVVVLAFFGGFWGLMYGVMMNIWFWPYAIGPANQYWEPGVSLVEILQRYALFYLTTSFWWDTIRSIGNIAFILALGLPTLRIVRRFHQRFAFHYQPLAAQGSEL
jgi:energy-coupling factor transport system substrate-specific component